MKKTLLSIAVAAVALTTHAQGLQAAFGCQEASTPYYEMGWDDASDNTWTYQSTSSSTWQLGNLASPFSSVEPASTTSLILKYDSGQNETATSPAINIRPGSRLEFYCYASGIYLVYGAWKLYAIVDNQSTLLIDQFLWAQDKGYDGPSWERFTVDLADYAGKQVQFAFVYTGNYGEDEAIDGFRILESDLAATSITINEGQSLHFMDMSNGATAWQWTFEGGEPATSTEQNPVVTYPTAGTYTVTLTASDGNGQSTASKPGYVIVQAEAPIAHIGMPAGAYLSPWCMMFVPTQVPLTFTDASTGNPTQWKWTFQGTDVATSTEQNPTVTYPNAGTFGMKLEVANAMGSSVDQLTSNAIQAGGIQEIWNIAPEENSSLMMMEMGWYGNYAGTNWLGIGEFAEHFDAPLADAQIEAVNIYFGKTTAGSTDADIEVKIMTPGDDGMPANVLATTSLKAGELEYDPTTINATTFTFDQPVPIAAGTEFFAVVGPFPNDEGDDIAILLCRRGEGEKVTAYHFVYDEDENYNYLETGNWFRNDDDPVSMAVAPVLNYDLTPTAITEGKMHRTVQSVSYVNLAGQVSNRPHSGVNIVVTRYTDGTQSATKMVR